MDLRFLERLYRASGPVASVYLDTTRAGADPAQRIERRWRALRGGLAEQGADPETLRALDAAAGGLPGVPGPQGEALFAAGGRLVAAFTLSRPPERDRAAWLPVADPVELVCDLDDGVPYVVVAADGEGADVYAYPAHGGLAGEERRPGGARGRPGEAAAGGRRHRVRDRAEQVWSASAGEVVRDVEAAVRRVRAAAVFVGGDERTLGLLRARLSTATEAPVIEVGGRGEGNAVARLRAGVEEGLRQTAVALRSGVLAEFVQDLGRAGRAVQGFADTTRALRSGRVSRLLLAPGGAAEPELWASRTDPLEVAERRGRLTDPAEAFSAPAGALLLRAAQATSAAFTRLPDPGEAVDGVGAFLRFAAAR
ncbi:baeRF2 domain-containing protein [Streptomonospora nanhaiensis]|uniref:Peptide chain release factor 1 n=1 Tax=Streptomonospora nanhaiensis TaxID=1323731 RepID=A0A853BQB0_9ACTN|nr:hypothetical protein [Streptomonospora nanhaiensis]MBV2365101.1 hypothetical protein [Streptomonospora nanhaiensis]NYI96691.1 hypothetical protein [Streptomonospora nanhaiensis]